MPILHAIVLGIVQGLAEFLPISSSGHLELVPWLFRWEELADPDLSKTFDVALHMGTFVGALAYFRVDVLRLVSSAVRTVARRGRVEGPDERLVWLLVASSVPAAAVGAALEGVIQDSLAAPWLIAVLLIVFGLVLWWADRLAERREIGEFGLRDALLMGGAQALALSPGVSRSGATISAGRVAGFSRDAAARLSFLMSLPIIGGAGLYKGLDVAGSGGIPAGFEAAFLWGTLASAVTGFAAVWLLLRYLRTRSFAPFVWYRLLAGLLILLITAAR